MKAVLVDDEPLALIGLRQSLEREVGGIEIAAVYSNPKEVIAGLLEHRPDVAFLDIRMPEIDGLTLGRQAQAALPGLEIVFVTSYDQYAVKAFELYALDYVMKPPIADRLRQTVMRIREKLDLKGARLAAEHEGPMLRCFGEIRIQWPGEDPLLLKWRTNKAQELFAYLLHHRERVVGRSALLELLWPNVEEERAAQQLYTAIYHIRQTLKAAPMEAVSVQIGSAEAGYRLKLGDWRVDAEVWEDDLKRLGTLDAGNAEAYERVLKRNDGDYLGVYGYLWAEHERERLRLLWLYQMKKLGGYYEQHGLRDKAIRTYLDVQRRYPDDEEVYFSLMRLYDAADHPAGVDEQYLLLKTRMERELELPVREDIVRWYESRMRVEKRR